MSSVGIAIQVARPRSRPGTPLVEFVRVAHGRNEAHAAALGGYAQIRVGQGRHAEGIAARHDRREEGGTRDMRAAGHQGALHRQRPDALAEPPGRRDPAGHGPGAVSVPHPVEEAPRGGKPCHARRGRTWLRVPGLR